MIQQRNTRLAVALSTGQSISGKECALSYSSFLRLASIVFATILFSSHAQALEAMRDESNNDFFQPYEVNSIMFKHTHDDDNASEINISMRYFFRSESEEKTRAEVYKFQPFFSYTGRLDFYWIGQNTRPSGPIVSRYQNPALHFRRNDRSDDQAGWFDVGIEHISNGQPLDAAKNKQLVLRAYQVGDRSTMDSVSRTAATVAITLERNTKFTFPLLDRDSELTFKWFAKRFGQEAEVFWGPHANENLDFNDFQIARIQWKLNLEDGSKVGKRLPRQFSAEMSIGAKGLSEDSWNFALFWPQDIPHIGVLPFALTVHRGPMNNMSDYTKSQNAMGIGFAFAY